MFYGFIVFTAALLALLFFIRQMEKRGRLLEREKQMEESLDDIHTANILRDSLRSNPDFVRQLRSRFTRQ